MNEIIRIAAIALTGTVLALTVRKYNPDLAFLLSIVTGIVVIGASIDCMKQVYQVVRNVFLQLSLPDYIPMALVKCAGVSVVSKITGELCRQSGENALAVKVELVGFLAGILSSIPLLEGVLEILSGFSVL